MKRFSELQVGEQFHVGLHELNGEKVLYEKIKRIKTDKVESGYLNFIDLTGGIKIRGFMNDDQVCYTHRTSKVLNSTYAGVWRFAKLFYDPYDYG